MHHPRPIRLLGAGLIACLATTGGVHALGVGADGRDGSARATGYGVILGSGSLAGVTADSTGIRSRSTTAGGLGGDTVGTVGSVTVEVIARPDGTTGDAGGSVVARDLRLLAGRVTVGEVRVDARATAALGSTATASASVSVSGLAVDGAPTSAGAGSRIEVPGAGVVSVGEVSAQGAGATNVNGLRVEVTDAAAGAVGASMVVGHLEVSATPGEKAPKPAPRPSLDPDPSVSPATPDVPPVEPRPSREPVPAREIPTPRSTPAITHAPATPVEPSPATPTGPLPRLLPGTPAGGGVTLTPSATGYAFPVAGQFSYSDDYGAPRAVTISHQGNDIFAHVGTPVVAVADGVLSQVGVNTLGGNRLWLTDDQGAAYYFAHLSAYAPVALDGARVKAGEVIAYVGNTGQAITTPPHLHFEVHPGGKEAASIDPYPLLRAWEQNSGTGTQLQAVGLPVLPDAAAGAVVVAITPAVEETLPSADGRASSAR